MANTDNKIPATTKLGPELFTAINDIAKENVRTRSQMIELLLLDHHDVQAKLDQVAANEELKAKASV